MRPRPPGCAVLGFPTDNDGFDGTTKPRARLIYPRPDRLDPENEARLASLPSEIGQYPQQRPAAKLYDRTADGRSAASTAIGRSIALPAGAPKSSAHA